MADDKKFKRYEFEGIILDITNRLVDFVLERLTDERSFTRV